jgi:hypothetical protein
MTAKFKVGDRCKVVNLISLALHPDEVGSAIVTIKESGEKLSEDCGGIILKYSYEVSVDVGDGMPFDNTAYENELELIDNDS